MARTICIEFPDPVTPGTITVPGVGDISIPRDFTDDAVTACTEARAFIQALQPVLIGLSMPLCVLDCVLAVTKVFDPTTFPPLDVSALTKIPEKCACLLTFTPFGFCGTLKGLVNGILEVIRCVQGLLYDIVALQARYLEVATNPDAQVRAFAGCLARQIDATTQNVLDAFSPVSALWDATSFLFNFVGANVDPIGDLTGGSLPDILDSLQAIETSVEAAATIINQVCP